MKIGFDAKRAFNNLTGLGNYSRSTIQILEKHFPDNDYFLYTPKEPGENVPDDFLDSLDVKVRNPVTPTAKLFKGIWRTYGGINTHIKKDEIDIFHGLSNELPVGIGNSAKHSVVTVHDVIFMRYPQFYPQIDRIIYQKKFSHACAKADRVICVSQQTANDVHEFFGTPKDKIRVVYQTCNEQFKVKASADVLGKTREVHKLPQEYMLYVGTIEERKNLYVVLQAMAEMGDNALPLVVVGRKTPYFNFLMNFIKKNKMENKVRFLDNVFFDQLPAIYQMAKIFVYPSKFEGFGIPMIEALYSGVPAIGATGSCLEEAGGPYSKYINPEDFNQLAQILTDLSKNEVERNKMINQGYKYVEKFDDNKLANDLMEVYNELR